MSTNVEQVKALLAVFQSGVHSRLQCKCDEEFITVSVNFNEVRTGIHVVWRGAHCGDKLPCTS
jgi:hypothetical protein